MVSCDFYCHGRCWLALGVLLASDHAICDPAHPDPASFSSRGYSHFQHRCHQGRVFIISDDAPYPFQGRVITGPTAAAALKSLNTDEVSEDHVFRMAYPCAPETFEALLLTAPDGSMYSTINETVAEGGLLRRGIYHQQLRRYMKYFKREQLLLLLTEEMFGDFTGAMDQVQSFLQLPYHNYSSRTFVNERGFTVLEGLGSKANGTPYSPMTPRIKQLLTEYYRPYTAQLVKFIEPARLQRYWSDVAEDLDRHIDDRDNDDDDADGQGGEGLDDDRQVERRRL